MNRMQWLLDWIVDWKEEYSSSSFSAFSFVLVVTAMVIVVFSLKNFTCYYEVLQTLLGRSYLFYILRIHRGQKSTSASTTTSDTAKVSHLFIYPVKSLRAVSLQEAVIDSKGFMGDRRFMFVAPSPPPVWASDDYSFGPNEATHQFVTQRQCPSLATIVATLHKDGSVTLSSTTESPSNNNKNLSVTVPFPTRGTMKKKKDQKPLQERNNTACNTPKTYRAKIWDDIVDVTDMGDDAATFIEQCVANDQEKLDSVHGLRFVTMAGEMGEGLEEEQEKETEEAKTGGGGESLPSVARAAKAVPPPQRLADGRYVPLLAHAAKSLSFLQSSQQQQQPQQYRKIQQPPHAVALPDEFPILIVNQSSLDELNRRLRDKGKETIPISQFRPNIVVSGRHLKPFEEDTWKLISIDGQLFHIVKECPRCKQSCTDQQTGKVSDEPLTTLADFRCPGNTKDSTDVYFGQYTISHAPTGTIRVGMSVEVILRGKPVWNIGTVSLG